MPIHTIMSIIFVKSTLSKNTRVFRKVAEQRKALILFTSARINTEANVLVFQYYRSQKELENFCLPELFWIVLDCTVSNNHNEGLGVE